MRVERCHHLHLLLITVSLACLLTGCGDSRYEQMRSRMAAIDSLNSHYQPFSVDSVSEMADYFESHGTPHDRIMAYYLLGSAFRDASEAPAALKVEDSAGSGQPTYYGAFHFDDGADSDLEYAYDQNGNMTKDMNKDITEIKYNLMNLPAKITYSDGKSLSMTYSADGERLSVTHNMVYTGDFNAYFGHFIYRNGSLNRVLVDGGYIYGSQYHFYLTDHLGNNRVVVNAGGTVEQVNHYYPYGGLTGESTGGSVQPYKYNGKELERMNGLDLYDYGARWMDAALGRFTTIDPMCEKYYDISPYAYCAGNPVNLVDPDGRDIVLLGDSINRTNSLEQIQKGLGEGIKIGYSNTDSQLKYQISDGYDVSSLTDEAKLFMKMVDNHNVVININATRSDEIGDGNWFFGGAFLGNELLENGIVMAYQTINPNHLAAMDEFGTPGQNIMHELTEAYNGAVLRLQGEDPSTLYLRAHNAATPQTEIFGGYYSFTGIYTDNRIPISNSYKIFVPTQQGKKVLYSRDLFIKR